VQWGWEGIQVWFWVGVIFKERIGVWISFGWKWGVKEWNAADAGCLGLKKGAGLKRLMF